ncbi:hypothetical protein SpCBS45565_g04640 [Spizellomyces sp. 'palustris']|nr:hypothetical protein SpCBS45565_g04640 [Spizellomyces sp. 'palustris']
MSLRNRKNQGKDPIAPFEEELLTYVNARHEDLVVCAQYFANSKNALQTKVSDIDSAGFTLKYVDKNMEGELAQKEVRVPFDRPVATKEAVKDKFLTLAKEARAGLGLVIDKKYVAPGSTPRLDFSPPAQILTGAAALWTVALGGAFAPLPPVAEFYRSELGGKQIFENVIMGVLALHGLEGLVVLGFGVYGRFPFIDLVKSVVFTILFGMACVGPIIKTAVKRKLFLDGQKESIKIG